jgi:D-tyrosyl-tRNA(Tyr) deacylase
MRLVIQRVKEAKVSVKEKDKAVGKINKGLFILIGVTEGDSREDAEKLAEKVSKLRIMADENGKMNLSIKDVGGEVLVVSQFTLYADTSRGNRPSFIKASVPGLAKDIYKHFVAQLKEKGIKVETGEFGAYMEIDTELDGPVTIIL